MTEVAASDSTRFCARIAVFAREPELGKVKSRLAAAVGDEAALAIYQSMLARVAALVDQFTSAEWDLWVTSNYSHENFISICNKRNIYLQKGGDLGAKMGFAIEQSLSRVGVDAVILIGTDCPALTQAYLERARVALDEGSDVVLGPAEDGGYVLIGARRPIPSLFEGVSWGTERVLEQTLARLEASQLSYQLLDTLWDVDRPEDLQRLQQLEPPLK